MASAEIRSHDEHLSACAAVHLRRDYVLTTELELRRVQPMSETSGRAREDDDRRYVATKLVNIAQSRDRSEACCERTSPPGGIGGLLPDFPEAARGNLFP